MTTFLLQSPDTNAIIRAAAERMIDSLRRAEIKLNRQVSNVQIEFPTEGETFALTLSRITSSEEEKQASGGVQSGGPSIASPGTVPAATNLEPTTKATRQLRTTKRVPK